VVMNCVSCSKTMTQTRGILRCSCGGAWVGEAHLIEMAEEMKGALVQLPWGHRSGAARPCPACGSPMETTALVTVALDRCAKDGIWFDANELSAVLERANSLPEELPAGWTPPAEAQVRDVKAPDHVQLHSVGNRIALGFFELLDGVLKPPGYYTSRAVGNVTDALKRR
jgi:Zn-finger nucleic acid-binding protein